MRKLSQYLNYLILAAIAGFGGIYFFGIKKNSAKHEVIVVTEPKSTVNVDEVVNKYMKQTATQMIREQVDSEIAIRQQLSQLQFLKKKDTVPQINPEDIPAEQQIWKDNKVNSAAAVNKRSQQEYEEGLKRQEEQEKKEFARQYIENARKDGYHVVLSPDLKVISVTPIRKPSQFNDSVESFPPQ